jgi:tRNA C32,U32 (ribose-2'-O)-methylase TrmJ
MISRLAANLGVTDIRLVAPQCSHTNSDGRRFAHHALPLLSSLPTYDTIEECAADCKFVIGSSARDCANVLRGCSFIEPQEIALACIREQLWGPDAVEEDDDASGRESKRSRTAGASPADASDDDDELLDAGKGAAMSLLAEVRRRPRQRFVSRGPRVLLLFGNESTGLTHAELSMAKYCVYIPTRGAYPSLNLAQAVTALLFTLWVTGHTHTYWPGVASTGVGLGSGVFDRDSVKMMLGLPDASSGEAGAASAAPSSTNAHMRRQTQLKPASVTQVERLRATLEATMARWGYKPAVLWPHKWHDSTHRIARQLTGALSEGDANLVFGLLSTFNSHPTAAALPPLEVAPPQGSVAPVETAADDKPTTN